MRKVYYIYNPKTRTYDRIYPTVRQRALSILRRLFVGMGVGAVSITNTRAAFTVAALKGDASFIRVFTFAGTDV
jgi:hypothetical protein